MLLRSIAAYTGIFYLERAASGRELVHSHNSFYCQFKNVYLTTKYYIRASVIIILLIAQHNNTSIIFVRFDHTQPKFEKKCTPKNEFSTLPPYLRPLELDYY